MCCDCNDIDINTGDNGYNGWSPILALVEGTCDGDDVIVHQLVSWTDGTGTRPDFNGHIMTDTWLTANPLYLGSSGLVEDICDATNLKPADGATGATGSTGATGEQGEPGDAGCDPTITITAQVEGSNPYTVTVTPNLDDPCAPSYNLEFPIDIFTNNPDLTTAIEDAVQGALQVTPVITPISTITPTSTPQVRVTSSSTFTLDTSIGGLYTSYTLLGNKMTLSFRFSIVTITSLMNTITKLELKIPGSKTSQNANESNAIGYHRNSISGTVMTPVISTNNVDTSYLDITFPINPSGTGLTALQGEPVTFQGQITFTIN